MGGCLPKPLQRRGCAWRDTYFLLIVKEVRVVRGKIMGS